MIEYAFLVAHFDRETVDAFDAWCAMINSITVTVWLSFIIIVISISIR